MEKGGLIERRKSKLDGRSVIVCLMPAGIALAEKAFREDMAGELGFLKGLTPEERSNLAALLKKLVLDIETQF